jgi:hypothetical protein
MKGGFADFVRIQSLDRSVGAGAATVESAIETDPSTMVGSIARQLSGDVGEDAVDGEDGVIGGGRTDRLLNMAVGVGGTTGASKRDTAVASRWRQVRLQLTAVAGIKRFNTLGAVKSSMVDDARAAIRCLKRLARQECLPTDQLQALNRNCDNLMHTVQRNELLRPLSHGARFRQKVTLEDAIGSTPAHLKRAGV